jgi:putative ABC transport system ATP-binding protein
MVLLEAEGISRRVSADRWLFRDLNIAHAAGEQLELQGASGVGKSTLLNLLAGLDQPDAGRLLFEGKDLKTMGANEQLYLRRTAFGFVFQCSVFQSLVFHRFTEIPSDRNTGRFSR